MAYFNALGQGRVGWKSGVIAPTPVNVSSLWTSVYAVYNADAVGSSSLNTSLFAAYNGESNANDSFGTNNGTAVGGLTYTTGKIGNAFQFNGTNAYVSLPNTSGEFNFTGDFTISTWVNVTLNTKTQVFFGNYANGGTYGYGYTFAIVGSRISLELRNGNTIGIYATPTSSIQANAWYNITVVRKVGQDTKIYVNGTLLSGNYTNGNNTIAPTYIASNACRMGYVLVGASSIYSDCKQDATTVWNRELTQSEITELYNSGNGAQYVTDSFYKPTTNDALNTYNGTAQGGLTYTAGKIGNAFTFNGTNSVVALPVNSMKFTGDYSYSFFIYFDFIGSQVKYIFNNETYNAATGGDNGYYITASNTGFAFKGIKNGAFVFQCQSTTTPTNGVWYHCVVTKTSSQVKMYINGNLETTTNYTGTVGYNTTMNPAIGAAYLSYLTNSYDYLYSGAKIDLFNIFEKALTLTEVTELYNSGSGKQYPN